MRPADAATLAQGFAAGLAVPLSVAGEYHAAVRLLLAAYVLDVLDGWLARRYGSAEDGFFLDRAFDRLSQVVAPTVLLAAWMEAGGLMEGAGLALYSAYFAGLYSVAFWRLVRRGVRSLAYFSGLPMFAHAIVALASVLRGEAPPPELLLALLAASALPVPYLRRLRGQATPSPAPWARAGALAALAVAPYDSQAIQALADALFWGVVAYAAVGPLPALAGLSPAPWREE